MRCAVWICGLVMVVASGACSSASVSDADALAWSSVPDDFSVDLTILVAPDGDRAHERTSRLVVFADGSVHYDARRGRGPNTLPGWVRHLDHAEMTRLWDAALRQGLTDVSKADPPQDLRRVRMPEPGGSIWLLAFTANGDRWNVLRACGPGEMPDEAMKAFARAALATAWAKDTPDEQIVVDPMRWAYGDDPWAVWNEAIEENDDDS